ncbi:MAG: tetratricopeptide repeat protein [Verrucomicrobiota bacterium]
MKRHRARQPAQRKGFLTEGFTRSEVARAADSRQPGQPSAVPALLRANPAGRFLSATGNRGWLLGLLLVLATVLAYQPVWHGGFLWDDDIHITNNRMLVEPDGLKQIWSSTDSPQYYPLVFTSFRLERGLWGLHPAGYHWVNLLLHAGSAVLVWRVLRRLKVPGAWLAAAVFALHPVNVESVAWISQRKNTLAMFFYLLSLLLYLRSESGPGASVEDAGWKMAKGSPRPANLHAPSSLFYWLSLGAFVLALLSKTAVSPFPLVLLGLAWWRRGRVTTRDVWRSAPFFTASLVLGLVTIWFERYQTALEIVRDDSFWSRLAGAGWAVWFYLYKAVLPLNVMPIYPRWRIDAGKVWSYIPGLLVVGGFLLCWRYRRSWGKAWLVGMGYFVVMLLPVLGFVNIGFMKYSLVADHWQYFSIIGPITLASAGVAMAMGRIQSLEAVQSSELLSATLCGAMLVGLGGVTWRQSAIYRDSETFWRAVLATNPGCWRAHYIFGDSLSEQGRLDEAIAHYQKALEIQPDYAYAHNNLGNALRQKGQVREALAHYRKALELQPDLAWAQCNLGAIFLQQGQVDEAIAQFQRALQTGLLMFKKPMFAPAGLAQIHFLLGSALARKGLAEEAMTHYREALAIQPDLAEAHYQLAAALQARDQADEASHHYREAIRLKPDWVEALNNLSWLLATQPEARFRDGKLAVQLAARAVVLTHTNDAKLLDTLGAALAEVGRFPEALDAARTAARLAQASGSTQLGREIEARRQGYERGQPFREPSAPSNWPSPETIPH